MTTSFLSHLECSACEATYEANQLHNLCTECGKPLLARYDMAQARDVFVREKLHDREPTLWRYAEMLPVQHEHNRLRLGEGYTPLFKLNRLGASMGMNHVYGKEESFNPTGSFKARGLALAVSRALELGAKAVAIPTAGNAGSAMAAYAAKAGLPAYVFMPKDAAPTFRAEAAALGATVTLVDGLITDAARFVREGAEAGRWFDVSTLKEPYRIEGKKTMGYELAEQFNWQLPDVIVYPTGGGTGIIGMWKAFDEMENLGWIGEQRPRMVSVQSAGCAPIVSAYEQGASFAEPWRDAHTIADGLRVPSAVGDFLILRTIKESNGAAVAVSDEAMVDRIMDVGAKEGLFIGPEAAATVCALQQLIDTGSVKTDDHVVLFFTGTGLKHVHLVEARIM